jgi:hypothetical protein
MGFLLWFTGFILAVFGFMGMSALQPAIAPLWISASFGIMGLWVVGSISACCASEKFCDALG